MSGAHAAIVLAAGGSTRLGRAKQLLTRGGETLVHRAARLALQTSPRQLLVVVGAAAGDVVRVLQDLPCEPVRNPDWQRGLGSSLHAAGARLRADVDAVLVSTCDQPALEARHLQALLEGARTAPSRCAAALHGDLPGVPAVVPRAWFGDAAEGDGAPGFGGRLRRQPAGTVFVLRAPELELDLDTPSDVSLARERGLLDAERQQDPQ